MAYNPIKKYHRAEIRYFPNLHDVSLVDKYVIHLYYYEKQDVKSYNEYKIFGFVFFKTLKETIQKETEVLEQILDPLYSNPVYKSFSTLGEAEEVARKLLSSYTIEKT